MAELAPQELIASLRKPKLLFTEDFLNDPIKVTTDERFVPETVIAQLNEIEVVDRDGASYGVINMSETGSVFYPIEMYSQVYDKNVIFSVINKEFKEL